jgi:ribonuclease-3
LALRFPFFNPSRTPEELELIRFVLKRFNYRPKKLDYFLQATTHKSLISSAKQQDNERLEFLGDAVLDTVVAEYLFHRFPSENEGYLTKIKSKIVNRKTLAEIAHNMEIRSILRFHSGRTINLAGLEGNAFEAILGAIYLDGGYQSVQTTVCNHIFRNYIDLNRVLEEEIDFKSKLFIWSQKKRLKLDFVLISEEQIGDGNRKYTISVQINDTMYGRGVGSSKKIAEQAASKETLILMGEI